MLLHELTWEDVQKLDKTKTVVILPVGSTEQHGPHNPLGTDFLIAETIARKEASSSEDILCLPTLQFGVAAHHREFPGTLWLTPSNYRHILKDLLTSIKYHGFKRVIFVNGHGGNTASIMEIISEFNDKYELYCLLFEWFKDEKMLEQVIGSSNIIHADAIETSVIWAATDSVKKEKLDNLTSADKWGRFIGEAYLASRTDQFTDSGIAGSLKGINKEKGHKIISESVEKLKRMVMDLQNYENKK